MSATGPAEMKGAVQALEITGNQTGSACITITLNETKDYTVLFPLLRSIEGEAIWQDVCTQAITADAIATLHNAPAMAVMGKFCVESVKNTLDACREKGHDGPIKIHFEIEDTTDLVIVKINDNGPGFDPKMLETLAEEKQKIYLTTVPTSEKKTGHDFGGAGLGVRAVLREIEGLTIEESKSDVENVVKLKQRYMPPDVHSIVFNNSPGGGGACVTLTSSKTPLQLIPEVIDDAEADMLNNFSRLKLRFSGLKPDARAGQSPTTVASLPEDTSSNGPGTKP